MVSWNRIVIVWLMAVFSGTSLLLGPNVLLPIWLTPSAGMVAAFAGIMLFVARALDRRRARLLAKREVAEVLPAARIAVPLRREERRRLPVVGVALVALTASTVFTLFLVGERPKEYLDVLENTFPVQMRHDLRNTFSVAAIVRRPVRYAEIEISSLTRLDLKELSIGTDKSGRDGMLSLGFISDLCDLAGSLGMEPVEYEMDVDRNRTRYSMYVMDFTDVLLPLVEARTLGGYLGGGLTTIYAGLFNESGLAHLYTGSRDFFSSRNSTITELTVSLNDKKQVFKRIKELSSEDVAAGVAPMLDAPALGTVSFSDLGRDDTVRLSYSIDRATVPAYDEIYKVWRHHRLELVTIKANGEVQNRMADFCFAV